MPVCPVASPRSGPIWKQLAGGGGWETCNVTDTGNWAEWSAHVRDSFWLSAELLDLLAEHPQGMRTQALLLRHAATDRYVALTLQDFTLRLDTHLPVQGGGEAAPSLRRQLLGSLSPRVAVLGQLLTSGAGTALGLQALPAEEATQLLDALAQRLTVQANGISAVVLKDLFPVGSASDRALRQRGYVDLPADPVMELDVSPFRSLEDYLSRLSSKYRVRYRRARAKLGSITQRPLGPELTEKYLDRLYALHRITRRGAEVNFVDLDRTYLHFLSTHGQVTGYFDGTELVGFTTAVRNGARYHAHFLGLDDSYKYSHHLYHNMLFDLLQAAIASPATVLDYGRTALEIKSSLGALPRAYAILATPRYRWASGMLPGLLSTFRQVPDWTARNPFRDADEKLTK